MEKQPKLLSEVTELELTTEKFVKQICSIIANANRKDYVLGAYIHSILNLSREHPIHTPFLLHHQDLYPKTPKERAELVKEIGINGRVLGVALRRGPDFFVETKRVTIVKAKSQE